MPDKDDPGRILYPGFTDRIMVDTFRGKVRVRKWPEKRGRPKSERVRAQNDWFRDVNKLASRAPGTQMASAIAITKNSGLYPRDILIRMMAGNLGSIPMDDGSERTKASLEIKPVTFQGARTDLLTPATLTANVAYFIDWPLPVFDPLGIWNVGLPKRLTVPVGVSVVRITGAISTTAGGVHKYRFLIYKNGLPYARLEAGWAFSNGGTIDSGPDWCVPGDYYELRITIDRNGSLLAGAWTNFAMEILTAE